MVFIVSSCGSKKETPILKNTAENEERSILVKLYDLTNGDMWKARINWNTEIHHCSWEGVLCNDKNLVEGLNLIGNNLTGEIPKELGNLKSLTWLGLSHNNLTGEIPKELGNLKSLILLDLSNNELTGEIPKELGNLKSLTSLYLSYNNLEEQV